jgi:anti-anti-sigma factor
MTYEEATVSDQHLHCGAPAKSAAGRSDDAAGLDVDVVRDDDGVIVRVSGELDILTSPELRERVLGVLDTTDSLLVDLVGVEFLSTSGVAALLDIGDAARRLGVRWTLVATGRSVLRPLEVSGAGRLLPIETSMATAIRRMRPELEGS